jgi:hypothetical protein
MHIQRISLPDMTRLRTLGLCLAFAFSGTPYISGAESPPIAGTWEGESKCTVPASPCHDEHVVYQIKKAKAGAYRLDAYKVVNGEEQFMGMLECEYRESGKKLSCTVHTARQDDWEFRLAGNELVGTLVLGKEKTLFRNIRVRRRE